jgi:glc operon protein GlcG
MADTVPHLKLTYEGANKILAAAVAKANAIGAPQCIVVSDDGGHMLAFARMDGAKVLSIDSATMKAKTAASSRVPTGGIPDAVLEGRLVAATQGKLTNLKGGYPIVVDGKVIGAIGLAALSGAKTAF